MKINESHVRKIIRKALLEAPAAPAGMNTPDQATSRKQQADNKIDDKVYEVSITNACQCHECQSGFTTFKTMRKFK